MSDREPVLPGIGRRLGAMSYEALLLVGVLAILIVPLIVLGWGTQTLLPIPWVRIYVFLGLAAYFIWHWHGGRQTLAMRTWKLRIAGADGGPPQLRQLAVRYVLAWPSIGLFGLGILWAFVDRDRQFLHDRLAGTRIEFSGAPPTTTFPRQRGGTTRSA